MGEVVELEGGVFVRGEGRVGDKGHRAVVQAEFQLLIQLFQRDLQGAFTKVIGGNEKGFGIGRDSKVGAAGILRDRAAVCCRGRRLDRLHRGGFGMLEEKAGQHQHRQPAAQHHAPGGPGLVGRGCRGGRGALRALLVQNLAGDLLRAAQLCNGAGFVFRPGGIQIIFVITQSVLALGLRQRG